jgi:protein O-GlcNAc transferase
VFARRPAPIQVTWLGYGATTGLPTMDYALFDDHHLTAGAEALMLERVVRLPHTRFCYAPPDYAAAVADPPSAGGAPVTFASFNNTGKLNDPVIALWCRVLAAVPGSRLLLKWRSLADPLLQAAIAERFARGGVDKARILFDGYSPHIDMLRKYGGVDIALDPFPFCGGLTSCEAMWMGVPVVTLPGARPLSRQTHAMLQAVGRSEWSARDADDYVGLAAGLAANPRALTEIRRGLRAQVQASPLCDAKGFARALEQSYRRMWHVYLGFA